MGYKWLPALALLATAVPASAKTLVVSTQGSDQNNGVNAPLRTAAAAVRKASSGDTILFKRGVYPAGFRISGARNLTFRGEEGAILDGKGVSLIDVVSFYDVSNVTLENLRIRRGKRSGLFCVLSDGLTVRDCEFNNNGESGILTGNTNNVLVEGCTSYLNGEHGVYLSQSGDHLTIRNCRSFNNAAGGLQINAVEESPDRSDPSFDSLSKDCLVEGNTIYGNGRRGGAAINLMGVQDSVIVNNLIHDNLAGGIAMFDDGAGRSFACKNNRILHNTILFRQGVGRYGVQVIAGSTGNRILNNIIACGRGDAIETTEKVQSNYNCLSAPTIANGQNLRSWQNRTGNDVNSFVGVPDLLANFHLGQNSPAQDVGTQVWDRDKDGRARPQGAGPDLGCFEIE